MTAFTVAIKQIAFAHCSVFGTVTGTLSGSCSTAVRTPVAPWACRSFILVVLRLGRWQTEGIDRPERRRVLLALAFGTACIRSYKQSGDM